MSLTILFHFLCAQHISDINISIFRSLRLFCWITTLVVLFLVRCVLEFRCGWVGVATCWVHKKWNKIASDIKLVFYSSTSTFLYSQQQLLYSIPRNSCELYENYLKVLKLLRNIKMFFCCGGLLFLVVQYNNLIEVSDVFPFCRKFLKRGLRSDSCTCKLPEYYISQTARLGRGVVAPPIYRDKSDALVKHYVMEQKWR